MKINNPATGGGDNHCSSGSFTCTDEPEFLPKRFILWCFLAFSVTGGVKWCDVSKGSELHPACTHWTSPEERRDRLCWLNVVLTDLGKKKRKKKKQMSKWSDWWPRKLSGAEPQQIVEATQRAATCLTVSTAWPHYHIFSQKRKNTERVCVWERLDQVAAVAVKYD